MMIPCHGYGILRWSGSGLRISGRKSSSMRIMRFAMTTNEKTRVIDITQELFSCNVYPGDMPPTFERVKTGEYLLSAFPISLEGSDGAPVRAVLLESAT